MFTCNKIIESTNTGVRAAACTRLGKHKYAFSAMLRWEDIKPEALSIICKNVKRSARRCEVKKSSVYDLKERSPILRRVLAAPLQKREVKCDRTGVK